MRRLIKHSVYPLSLLFLVFSITFSFCKKEEKDPDVIPAIDLVLSHVYLNLYDEEPDTIYLATQPGGTIDWAIENEEEWLTFEPTSGKIDKDIIEIIVKADTSKIVGWGFQTQVEFMSDQTYKTAKLYVQLKKNQNIHGIEISDGNLILDYGEDTANFTIKNTGVSEISWDISDIPYYFQLSSISGILEGGAATEIVITADRTGLITLEYHSFLKINSNVGESKNLNVTLKNYNDQLDILPYLIVDATYIPSKDKIALISIDPDQLVLLNPINLATEQIEIPEGNLGFSIEANGNFAAIGYNDKFLLVNLNTLFIEAEFEVELELFSILLRNETWAYVFSSEVLYANSYTHVQSINLSTGEIAQNYNWVTTNQIGQVHSSDNYIYAKGPGRYYKYDISSDTASRLYYKNGGSYINKYWLTDEGDRMFLGNGSILRLSDNEEDDLVYGGSLGEDIVLIGFDQASTRNLIFCLQEDTEIYSYDICTNLRTYTLDYVDLLDEISLPSYFIPYSPTGGEVYQPNGKYVFVNSTEDKAFVLQRAIEGYPGYHNWALATFDINF